MIVSICNLRLINKSSHTNLFKKGNLIRVTRYVPTCRVDCSSRAGSNHSYMGSFINHVDRPLDFLTTSPLCGLHILLIKAYEVIWTFGKPPSPAMSTWFMNAPYDVVTVVFETEFGRKNHICQGTRARSNNIWGFLFLVTHTP